MNIVIIGMSGAGKTTIGENIAKKLNYSFFDSDELIIEYMGMSIDKIFKEYGEKKFRDIEEKVIRDISSKDKAVISTGGGAILRQVNIEKLKHKGRIFYLEAGIDTLIRNLKSSYVKRPLLENEFKLQDNLKRIYDTRKALYREYADIIISVDGRSIEDISSDIMETNKNVES